MSYTVYNPLSTCVACLIPAGVYKPRNAIQALVPPPMLQWPALQAHVLMQRVGQFDPTAVVLPTLIATSLTPRLQGLSHP